MNPDCRRVSISGIITLICIGPGALPALAQFDYSPGFEAGVPDEMEHLSFLEGTWAIDLYFAVDPSAEVPDWRPWGASHSTVASHFNGSFLRETSLGFPINRNMARGHDGLERWIYDATWTYDRFRREYRTTYLDNVWSLADVYTGAFRGDTLYMSNLNSGTVSPTGPDGMRQANRLLITDITENGFSLTWQLLSNPPERGVADPDDLKWTWAPRMEYRRIAVSN